MEQTSTSLCPSYDEMKQRFLSQARHYEHKANKAVSQVEADQHKRDAAAFQNCANRMAELHREVLHLKNYGRKVAK